MISVPTIPRGSAKNKNRTVEVAANMWQQCEFYLQSRLFNDADSIEATGSISSRMINEYGAVGM
jgi:hypothetical protein